MSGNEILINLNNVENLGQYELMAGLLELAKRDKKHEHNWNTNPITARCIKVYKEKVRGYNAKRTIQGALMLHLLRIRSGQSWEITSKRLLFLLHKYRARDFALMFSIFHNVKDIDNDDHADVISNQNVAETTWKLV